MTTKKEIKIEHLKPTDFKISKKEIKKLEKIFIH